MKERPPERQGKFMYLFILYLMTQLVAQINYVAPHGRMIHEQWIGKDKE
jgi:hypothetical protein